MLMVHTACTTLFLYPMLRTERGFYIYWIQLCVIADLQTESGRTIEMRTSLCVFSLGCFPQNFLISIVVKEGGMKIKFPIENILNISRINLSICHIITRGFKNSCFHIRKSFDRYEEPWNYELRVAKSKVVQVLRPKIRAAEKTLCEAKTSKMGQEKRVLSWTFWSRQLT